MMIQVAKLISSTLQVNWNTGYTTAFVCQVQVEINSGGTLNSDFSGSKKCSMTLTEVRHHRQFIN